MSIDKPGDGKKSMPSSTRTRILCPECNAENFVNLNKLTSDEVLCPCGEKIDVRMIKYSLTSASSPPDRQGGYPRMLGRYKLIKKLGAGGQASVHLGTDPLGRKVAVKEYDPKGADWERASGEASCCMRCSCLNIVNTYDILDEHHTIVQEYAEGDTLRKVITARVADVRERGATLFPIDQVVELIVGILQGLLVCHVRGVIHLDIKPENIMIDSTGGIRIPKIFDFGLARNLREEGERTSSGIGLARGSADVSFQGTPAYAAPEQIDPKQKHKISARTDIYQCGIMFYELLSGRVPFEGKAWEDIFRGVLAGTPTSLSELGLKIPAELIEVQEKMCAHDADKRYGSVQDVLERLELWRANRSVAHYKEASKHSRRWSYVLVLVLGLACGAALGLAPQATRYLFVTQGRVSEGQVQDAAMIIMEQKDLAIAELRRSGGSQARAQELLEHAEAEYSVLSLVATDSAVLANLRGFLDEAAREIGASEPGDGK